MLFAIAAAERCFLWLRNNERAHAPARFQHAHALQLGIDLSHRVRIDAQIHRQLPHSRQLLADPQFAGSDREPDRALKLSIERRRMIWVYVEHRSSSLLYYDNSTSRVSGFQPQFQGLR